MSSPNQYHLAADGITISYSRKARAQSSRARVVPSSSTSQDAQRELTFSKDKVTTTNMLGVGTLVTVTVSPPLAKGVATFTLVLPPIELSDDFAAPVALHVPRANDDHGSPIRGKRTAGRATALRIS
jgi:hypothetical protein